MAPAFKLTLQQHASNRWHAQSSLSLLHPGCWEAGIPGTGMPPALGKESLVLHAWLDLLSWTIHLCRTGCLYRTNQAQKVIWIWWERMGRITKHLLALKPWFPVAGTSNLQNYVFVWVYIYIYMNEHIYIHIYINTSTHTPFKRKK